MITKTIETKKQMDDLIVSCMRKIRNDCESTKEVAEKLQICPSYVCRLLKGQCIPYNNMNMIKTILKMGGETLSKYHVWVVNERGNLLDSVDLFPKGSDVKTKLMLKWYWAYENKRFCFAKATMEDVLGKSCTSWRGFRKAVFGKTKPSMRTINSLYRAMDHHLIVVVY